MLPKLLQPPEVAVATDIDQILGCPVWILSSDREVEAPRARLAWRDAVVF